MPLVIRLAWRNLRARPGQALLLLFALSLSTATLSLALAISETGYQPWERVWHATNGFHVQTSVLYRPGFGSPAELRAAPPLPSAEREDALRRLAGTADDPEVAEASGPWPELLTNGRIGGSDLELFVQARAPEPAVVGHPLLVEGHWLDGGDGVVLENGLATALDVKPGDTVTIAGHTLPVNGVAITVSRGPYPMYQPGWVWATPATAELLRAAGAQDFAASLEVRLKNPDAAEPFARAHAGTTWLQQRAETSKDMEALQIALLVSGTLLTGLCIATTAVLVAGRLAAQVRQVGTLKAVGVTPWQVTRVLLVEYLAIAGLAAVVGVVIGTGLSPVLARTARELYGAPQAPPITLRRTAIVALVAVAVVVLATVRPALRATRDTTLRALATQARAPRRTSRLARLATRLGLPLPVTLGLRSAGRRPGRTLANAFGLTLGVAALTVGLALDKSLDSLGARLAQTESDPASRAASMDLANEVRAIVFVAAALLLAIAAVNAIATAMFAARDSARNHAILRTIGATPRQSVIAFVVAQLGGALLACAAGIPLGVLIFNSVAEELAPSKLSGPTYAAIALVAALGYAILVAAPARLLARQPVTAALAYE